MWRCGKRRRTVWLCRLCDGVHRRAGCPLRDRRFVYEYIPVAARHLYSASLLEHSAGPGLGFSAGGILQVGSVGLESKEDFTGVGIQTSGFLAGGSWGISGTAVGSSANLPLIPGNSYSGLEGGAAYGAGASASAELTYTKFVGDINFASAPKTVQTALCVAPR